MERWPEQGRAPLKSSEREGWPRSGLLIITHYCVLFCLSLSLFFFLASSLRELSPWPGIGPMLLPK